MATSDWRVAISAGYFHSGHYGLDLLKPQTRRCLVGPANEISLMKGFPFGSFPEGNQCIQKVKRCDHDERSSGAQAEKGIILDNTNM